MAMRSTVILVLLLTLIAGCSTTGGRKDGIEQVPLHKAVTEIPEDQLLDVWIELFEPGELPEDEEDAAGLSMDIREAEARYMPVHLRDTMEKTGYWGAVRVVPQGTEGSEVLVRGEIVGSDAERLELKITALDATGRQWFTRTYEAEVPFSDYLIAETNGREVFQPLYNNIANDLAAQRAGRTNMDILEIRRVAALRFAADLSPDAFSGYLQRDRSGGYTVKRLPARDDPMYKRVNAIRDRDYLLIDTLNGHFDNFYLEVQEPYTQWRKSRSEEMEALRKIEREAMNRKLIGAAAIVGAIAIEALAGGETRAATGDLRNIMIAGGAYAIKTGFDKDSETTIHRDAIGELGDSFAAETRPLVVEVEGETHELTGSAEVQYSKWRNLLKRIYASETGLGGNAD